jgi:hypothetical protein
VGDALELHRAQGLQVDGLVDAVGGRAADQDLARGRPGGQAGGDVDGGAVDVAVLEDHRAAVDADMGRRQAGSWRLGDHLEGGLDGVGGLAEDEHAGVAQPADRAAGVAARDALDEGAPAAPPRSSRSCSLAPASRRRCSTWAS